MMNYYDPGYGSGSDIVYGAVIIYLVVTLYVGAILYLWMRIIKITHEDAAKVFNRIMLITWVSPLVALFLGLFLMMSFQLFMFVPIINAILPKLFGGSGLIGSVTAFFACVGACGAYIGVRNVE